MPRVKCIKGFCVEKCDDDGFMIENEYVDIEEGSIWSIDGSSSRIAGGEVRLERWINDNTLEWVELPQETLDEYFELLEG